MVKMLLRIIKFLILYSGNKAFISKYMKELEEILINNPNLYFGYEASVCGGIPIINSLLNDYVCDNIMNVFYLDLLLD